MSKAKTFHEHGATEVRLTVLANNKRVDFHIFEADGLLGGSLKELFDKAPDGGKCECTLQGDKLVELPK